MFEIRANIKSEYHWSCVTHLSTEDMLKSAAIEAKKFENIDLDQGQ